MSALRSWPTRSGPRRYRALVGVDSDVQGGDTEGPNQGAVLERDLADREPPVAAPGWLDDAPAELHGHLEPALGRRTKAVVKAVLHTLTAGGPGDEAHQDALTDGPGYTLADHDAERAAQRLT